jgi:hypothetical protein
MAMIDGKSISTAVKRSCVSRGRPARAGMTMGAGSALADGWVGACGTAVFVLMIPAPCHKRGGIQEAPGGTSSIRERAYAPLYPTK